MQTKLIKALLVAILLGCVVGTASAAIGPGHVTGTVKNIALLPGHVTTA